MDRQPAKQAPSLSLPARINEGMEVHDRDEEPIGYVQLVYYGGASESAIERALKQAASAAVTVVPDAASGAFGNDGVPLEMRAHLLRHGYIRIEGPGIAGVKRYVTAEQIDDVSGNRVKLRATRDELSRA